MLKKISVGMVLTKALVENTQKERDQGRQSAKC
jgi:hypothetical protein